jgi:hypothetical protein
MLHKITAPATYTQLLQLFTAGPRDDWTNENRFFIDSRTLHPLFAAMESYAGVLSETAILPRIATGIAGQYRTFVRKEWPRMLIRTL